MPICCRDAKKSDFHTKRPNLEMATHFINNTLNSIENGFDYRLYFFDVIEKIQNAKHRKPICDNVLCFMSFLNSVFLFLSFLFRIL